MRTERPENVQIGCELHSQIRNHYLHPSSVYCVSGEGKDIEEVSRDKAEHSNVDRARIIIPDNFRCVHSRSSSHASNFV